MFSVYAEYAEKCPSFVFVAESAKKLSPVLSNMLTTRRKRGKKSNF